MADVTNKNMFAYISIAICTIGDKLLLLCSGIQVKSFSWKQKTKHENTAYTIAE